MFGSMFSIVLYGFLGFALSASGVGVMEKPWQFIMILALVVVIEWNARYGRKNAPDPGGNRCSNTDDQ